MSLCSLEEGEPQRAVPRGSPPGGYQDRVQSSRTDRGAQEFPRYVEAQVSKDPSSLGTALPYSDATQDQCYQLEISVLNCTYHLSKSGC